MKYPRDNHLFWFISICTTWHSVARTNQVSPIRDLSRLSRNDREEKKIRWARADLRNYSARDDEIVLARTHRDSRQALTAMTYDLESLVLLTTPSLRATDVVSRNPIRDHRGKDNDLRIQ